MSASSAPASQLVSNEEGSQTLANLSVPLEARILYLRAWRRRSRLCRLGTVLASCGSGDRCRCRHCLHLLLEGPLSKLHAAGDLPDSSRIILERTRPAYPSDLTEGEGGSTYEISVCMAASMSPYPRSHISVRPALPWLHCGGGGGSRSLRRFARAVCEKEGGSAGLSNCGQLAFFHFVCYRDIEQL